MPQISYRERVYYPVNRPPAIPRSPLPKRRRLTPPSPPPRQTAYALFGALAFSTFPITPLLLPLIDTRRTGDARQSDYVPSAFRSRRLAAVKRLGVVRAAVSTAAGGGTVATLRGAAAAESELRPSAAALLAAIVEQQRKGGRGGNGEGGGDEPLPSEYLENLAGGGEGGRRWQLVYTAGKDAVVATRNKVGERMNDRQHCRRRRHRRRRHRRHRHQSAAPCPKVECPRDVCRAISSRDPSVQARRGK